MKRRTFLWQSSLLSTGITLLNRFPSFGKSILTPPETYKADLFQMFKEPLTIYRPFVRWWWNGDKVEKAELSRELRLMKEAGIGGVEINPIKFPPRTEDMGKPSLRWLSDEWIDALQHTFSEAKSLDMTCDLIVGSGWPFGAEYLEGEERAQLLSLGTKKLEGAIDYEASVFDLLKEADPAVSSPSARRKLEILSVTLVPDPFTSIDQVKDFTGQVKSGFISFTLPSGKFVLYTLVKISGFLEVINGAPGANGPVLNHYNEAAVKKYLYHMSNTIQKKTGPLSKYIRALFTDSMELEGANWTIDMAEEFSKRRGYALMPYLPYTQFKIGSMGNVYDYKYGADLGPEMKNILQRVRYDFDLTKAELLQERFINTFIKWCKELNVKSRAQAYGRGYFPLEGSLDMDIPESETWVKYGIGKEMPELDYRIGRAYTMVNKYVSSAAHLRGKRLISCEELTNTDMVFNETMEVLKLTGDLSIISGVTHPIFHGFNYSPPDAPFPGWVRYGTFLNERNPWWPYFRKFADYKARLSALLQQADMFADIAVLTPVTDIWTVYSAQNEPFPSFLYPDYISLVWEAMHQNGNACDYISESILQGAEMKNGLLKYGSRSYHTLFLLEVLSLEPSIAKKLLSFVENGGRIFCIEAFPERSLGRSDFEEKDKEVNEIVLKMKAYTDRFILIKKPEKDYLTWYRAVQKQYKIDPYIAIDQPSKFVTQVRYQAEGTEMLFVINSGSDDARFIRVTPSENLIKDKLAWIWDPETGERFALEESISYDLDLGPADSVLLVFQDPKFVNDNAGKHPLASVASRSAHSKVSTARSKKNPDRNTAIASGLVPQKRESILVRRGLNPALSMSTSEAGSTGKVVPATSPATSVRDGEIPPLRGSADLPQVDPTASKSVAGKETKAVIANNRIKGTTMKNSWSVEFNHINGSIQKTTMPELADLRDLPEFAAFSGTAIYRSTMHIADHTKIHSLDLGKVHGVSELLINGKTCGVQWYGRRTYAIAPLVQNGPNAIEVRVVTTMGNYLKTLKDNLIAQFWTNEKRKDQPVQSMGLIGPLTLV